MYIAKYKINECIILVFRIWQLDLNICSIAVKFYIKKPTY